MPVYSLCLQTFTNFSVLRYKPNTFQGLLSNKVTSLSAGDDRGVWVGSNVGLSFFNHKLGKVEHMINQAVVNKFNVTTGFDVNLLQAMPDGSVWVSAWGKGLFHFNPPNDLQPFPFRNNEAGMKWTSLFLDQNRLLLGAQAKGLFAFDLATKSFYNPYVDFSSQELKNKNKPRQYFYVVGVYCFYRLFKILIRSVLHFR